jgi:hypothetical protein
MCQFNRILNFLYNIKNPEKITIEECKFIKTAMNLQVH